MPRILRLLYHFGVPRFASYYCLVLWEGGRRTVQYVEDPLSVPDYYQDRLYVVSTFLFLGKPRGARWKPYL